MTKLIGVSSVIAASELYRALKRMPRARHSGLAAGMLPGESRQTNSKEFPFPTHRADALAGRKRNQEQGRPKNRRRESPYPRGLCITQIHHPARLRQRLFHKAIS